MAVEGRLPPDSINKIPGLVHRSESRWPNDWLNAAGLPVSSSEAIATIIDRSGQGNHINQPHGSCRPLWSDEQINGFGCASYDGIDDFMSCGPADRTSQSVFVLGKFRGVYGNQRLFAFSVTRSLFSHSNTGTKWGYYQSEIGPKDIGGNVLTWSLVEVHYKPSENVAAVAGAETPLTFVDAVLGGHLAFAAEDATGSGALGTVDIAGCWRWNRALNFDEKVSVRHYVHQTYGA